MPSRPEVGRKRECETEDDPLTKRSRKELVRSTRRVTVSKDKTMSTDVKTARRTTLLSLPTEIRQKILSYTITDIELIKHIHMTVNESTPYWLKTVYNPRAQPTAWVKEMERLFARDPVSAKAWKARYLPDPETTGILKWISDLSAVHAVMAEEMKWVASRWKKRGDAIAEEQARWDAEEDEIDRQIGIWDPSTKTWAQHFMWKGLRDGYVLEHLGGPTVRYWRDFRVQGRLTRGQSPYGPVHWGHFNRQYSCACNRCTSRGLSSDVIDFGARN